MSLLAFPLCQQGKSDSRYLGHHLATQGLPKPAQRTLFRAWDCSAICLWNTNMWTCTCKPPQDDNRMRGNKWMMYAILRSGLLQAGVPSPQVDSVSLESKRMRTKRHSSTSPSSLYYKKQHRVAHSRTAWRNNNLRDLFEGTLTPVTYIHGGMSLQPLLFQELLCLQIIHFCRKLQHKTWKSLGFEEGTSHQLLCPLLMKS